MAAGRSSPVVDHWVTEIDASMVAFPVQTAKETEVFNMCGSSGPANARKAAADGWPRPHRLSPPFVWGMLLLLLALVIGYQVLFARAGQPLLPQAVGVAATTGTLVAGLVLVYVLDMPFADRGAAIAPTRMQVTATVLESQYQGSPDSIPCDAAGHPRT